MSCLSIYHNPRCSKSRNALAYLEKNQSKYKYTIDVILYQKEPPTRVQLEKLSSYLGLTNKSVEEAPWKILLRPDAQKLASTWEEAYQLLESDPKHLERPFIVEFEQGKAALGRPDLTDVEALVQNL
ncbi:hypothetical protein INT47_000384 [Mucor saturninus]|uniref:Arsenate reductase n=1 Tax=Mucor saturninus TaxID=64648 RepID=A0A8H7QSY1_9FUNG|nr:hypothetical protein INT47_000384 [Mucor saturninus]